MKESHKNWLAVPKVEENLDDIFSYSWLSSQELVLNAYLAN